MNTSQLKLQMNLRGAWRDVRGFDQAEEASVKSGAELVFGRDEKVTLRIIAPGESGPPLACWSAATGWRTWEGRNLPRDPELFQPSTLTCVYCGHEYPQGTPAAHSQVLTDHINLCEKHPLHQARKDITLLRTALGKLLGADTAQELQLLDASIRAAPGVAADKALCLDAIHAMQSTMPAEPAI